VDLTYSKLHLDLQAEVRTFVRDYGHLSPEFGGFGTVSPAMLNHRLMSSVKTGPSRP
jgi:hypothetical protein